MIERKDDWFFRVRCQTIRQCLHHHRIGGIPRIASAFANGPGDQVKRKTDADTTLDSLDLVLAILEQRRTRRLARLWLGQNQVGVVGLFPRPIASRV